MNILLGITLLLASVNAEADYPCCEAYPLLMGENVWNDGSDVVIDIEEATSPRACCNQCREFEGCEGYVFIYYADNLGGCYYLNEKHDMDNLVFDYFNPFYSGNNNFPGEECNSVDCTSEIDIFVVLDKSESVHENADHSLSQSFLERVLSIFHYANNEYGARASITMFGGGARKLIQLKSDEATDLDAIRDAITFEEEPSLGWTDLPKTLRYLARKELPHSRKNAEKLLFILSDGRVVKDVGSARREMVKAKKILRKLNKRFDPFSVFTIGVGNYNLNKLLALSTPHPYFTFLRDEPIVFPAEEIESSVWQQMVTSIFTCGVNNALIDSTPTDVRTLSGGSYWTSKERADLVQLGEEIIYHGEP